MHLRLRLVAVALAALAVGALLPAAAASSARPSIAAISPLAGRPKGGSTLTIRGTSLGRVTAVSFGRVRSRKITHTSAHRISVVVPAHSVGAVRVRLVTHGVAGADSAKYRYVSTPTQLRWSRDHTIDPDIGDLAGLTCPTRHFCASVDASESAPALVTFAPHGRAHRSPLPRNKGVPAVSCNSASRCFAVLAGRVSHWNGNHWSMFRRVAPAKSFLNRLSCVAGVQFCLAVAESGATWLYRATGWSRAAKVPSTGYDSTFSCVTAHFCMLVTDGQAFRFDGSAWHAASQGLSSDTQYESSAIACTSTSFCMLAGGDESSTWNGSRWHTRFGGYFPDLFALACASSRECVFAGEGGNLEWRDGHWHPSRSVGHGVIYPGASCPDSHECLLTIRSGVAIHRSSGWTSHYIERSGGDLSDVSCTSTSWCMAVDGHGNAVRLANDKWARPHPIDRRRALSAVSCAGHEFCVAVDGADPYDEATTPGVGHAVIYQHGRWRAPTVIDPQHGLTDVACPSNRMCIAVDDAGRALRWNGDHWSAPRHVGALFEAVACPSTTRCIAVGHHTALWHDGHWHSIRNPAGSRQLTDVTCTDRRYCVAGGYGGFFVRNGGVWSDAIHHARLLWQVQVACISRSACFGSQDNQVDVWDYAFDGSRVAYSTEEIFGPKMSCVPHRCVAVSLDYTDSGRPIQR